MTTEADRILQELHELADPQAAEGMFAFGVHGEDVLGIRIPELRRIARREGRDQALAEALWASGTHEARILASMVADPALMTPESMDAWAVDFDSWDLCDQCCGNLFVRTPWAYTQALTWSERQEEFVRRAGFALMAYLAVHDKSASEAKFEPFLDKISTHAQDGRNYVKKAVNWALRQIGKRSQGLNIRAIEVADLLAQANDPTARWIGKDALRELTSTRVQSRWLREPSA